MLKNNPEFNHDHVRLYKLIWKRAVSSQMEKHCLIQQRFLLQVAMRPFQVQGSSLRSMDF